MAGSVARAEAVGVVNREDMVDMLDMVDTVEAVEPKTATKLSAPIAKMTAILQMHDESGNAHRREETILSASASTARCQDTLKSGASPTHV